MRSFTQTILALACLYAGLGCTSKNAYFCVVEGAADELGCFSCKGSSCKDVLPPPRPACEGDFECTGLKVCTTLGCTKICSDDSTCARGTVCSDGLCLGPNEARPDLKFVSCVQNGDCPRDDLICIDAVCEADSPSNPRCTNDDQCADDEYCANERCTFDDRPQHFCPNTPCADGHICRNGQCRTPCDSDDECARIDASIRFCRDNLCVRSSEILSNCELDLDCNNGERCVDGSCR